jgi:hypothetical protein
MEKGVMCASTTSGKKKDEDEECEDQVDGSEEECEDDEKKKVEENVRKNKNNTEVTFDKTQNPEKEKVSKFSKGGDKTDGDSGYEEKKPSAETPDSKGEGARKKIKGKDNETVPGKEGNSGKAVSEGYSEFKKGDPKLDSTKFTKEKKGTENKEPGFDGKGDVGEKMYDDDVDHGATEELAKDSKLDDTNDAGFSEKEKPSEVSRAKKKAFPSKNPKVQGTPGAVKD